MTRMVVDTNCLQPDELRDYLLESPRNKVVVAPLVELDMLKESGARLSFLRDLRSTDRLFGWPWIFDRCDRCNWRVRISP